MIDDRDSWHVVNLLLKRCGAERVAVFWAQCADELLEPGAVDGCAIWKRILEAVTEFERGLAWRPFS